ncbi:hypothetical protein ABZ519_17330 [Streptomyces collinus]|uniref:hypothetical protein n=1 Tax=Streptomyces collinus TaxID=42684 RepID=UPI0033F0E7B5
MNSFRTPRSHTDQLRALPAGDCRPLPHALADRFHQAGDDTEARCRHLALCVLVAEGLHGSERLADDPLAAERRKALDDLARRQSFWYAARFEILGRMSASATAITSSWIACP